MKGSFQMAKVPEENNTTPMQPFRDFQAWDPSFFLVTFMLIQINIHFIQIAIHTIVDYHLTLVPFISMDNQ